VTLARRDLIFFPPTIVKPETLFQFKQVSFYLKKETVGSASGDDAANDKTLPNTCRRLARNIRDMIMSVVYALSTQTINCSQ